MQPKQQHNPTHRRESKSGCNRSTMRSLHQQRRLRPTALSPRLGGGDGHCSGPESHRVPRLPSNSHTVTTALHTRTPQRHPITIQTITRTSTRRCSASRYVGVIAVSLGHRPLRTRRTPRCPDHGLMSSTQPPSLVDALASLRHTHTHTHTSSNTHPATHMSSNGRRPLRALSAVANALHTRDSDSLHQISSV